MALSAHNGSERARQLLALTRRLAERLVFETATLEAHRPQDLYAGMEETRNLSNLYRHETARIKADPSLLDGIGDADKAALREATQAFQVHLRRYELAVNAAKTITEGIIAAVAQDMSLRRAQNLTYGAKGRTQVPGPQSLNYSHKA
jgi:hypothetical protein